MLSNSSIGEMHIEMCKATWLRFAPCRRAGAAGSREAGGRGGRGRTSRHSKRSPSGRFLGCSSPGGAAAAAELVRSGLTIRSDRPKHRSVKSYRTFHIISATASSEQMTYPSTNGHQRPLPFVRLISLTATCNIAINLDCFHHPDHIDNWD